MKKELSIDTIERWLKDSDCDVRTAAMNIYKSRDIKLPVIRTVEPPEKIYKKCAGNVIVVAEIPKDAQVRGRFNSKCRASKAKIVDIIGDFCGEKVGISIYDRTTTYFVGDDVEIDNFDFGNEECSTGFHFFCTKEQAENY